MRFPAGTYRTGPLQLASGVTLRLDRGATLLFSDRFDDYPTVTTRWEGVLCQGYSPLLRGEGLHDVAIVGEGVVDGQGAAWWQYFKDHGIRHAKQPVGPRHLEFARLNRDVPCSGSGGGGWHSQFLRPALVQFLECRNIRIEGVTFQNSPFWNVHLVFCEDARLRNVTFFNPPGAPNGDGLDLDSCRRVRVRGCTFDVNDDCVCLKSGVDEEGRRLARPTEDVVVSRCTMRRGHGGVVFGSEMSGGIRNVTVEDCEFVGTARGIRIKTRRGRGGVVANIRCRRIRMRGVATPLAVNLYYHCTPEPPPPDVCGEGARPVDATTPAVRDIRFEDVTADGAHVAAGFLWGLPEQPVEKLVIRNYSCDAGKAPLQPGWPDSLHAWTPAAGMGLVLRFVRDVRLHNVRIRTPAGQRLHVLGAVSNVRMEHME